MHESNTVMVTMATNAVAGKEEIRAPVDRGLNHPERSYSPSLLLWLNKSLCDVDLNAPGIHVPMCHDVCGHVPRVRLNISSK